ncbi:MAG: long-chain fatty acid--CoA ligase [Betaproteobacteria bacterium]|nr:long-chain fatty acid--CoA ligase [Betaproteobacteria bacterium]
MRGQMMAQPLLISALLRHAARWHGETEIISRTRMGCTRLDWRRVERRARCLGEALLQLGVHSGDRVATLGWNHHRHLEAYFAIPGIGAICHTLNPRLNLEQLAFIIREAKDVGLLVDTDCLPLVASLQGLGIEFSWVIVMDEQGGEDEQEKPGFYNYETLLAAQPATLVWPEISEECAAGLCFTSGTTGDPKGVLYSHRSIVLHAMSVALPDGLGFSACTVALPVVPLFHANAWGFPHAAALVGAKLVLPGPWLDGASLYALLEQEHVTLSAGVPTVWKNLMDHLQREDLRLHHLQLLGVGGAPCPDSLIRYFEGVQGVSVRPGWGMTETSPVAALMSPKPNREHWSSEARWNWLSKAGRPPYGVDFRVVDEHQKEVSWDGCSSGYLEVRGHWVCRSYWHEESEKDESQWLVTGDVATIDEEGYLQITDRVKDLIKSGGEWISSVQIERVALRCPELVEVAVIAIPDVQWGERPLLLAVPRPGVQPDAQALLQYLAQHLPRWWLPERLEIVHSLPLTSVGKVDKKRLRSIFSGQ